MAPMILIGNPGNRRTNGLQAARVKLGMSPAVVVPYLALLKGEISLAEVAEREGLQLGKTPWLRLDAPGEDHEVECALIALGSPDAAGSNGGDRLLPFGARSDPDPWSQAMIAGLKEQPGRLYHPSQWFRGYGRLLARLEQEAAELWPEGQWVNAPRDIVAMFDKRRTHEVLQAAGVPVPRPLAEPDRISNCEELKEFMIMQRKHRIFIKLACGSGACGVVAYQINPVTGAELAVTTVGVESYLSRPSMFYNSMKILTYSDRKTIRLIVNWLLQQGTHIEQWIAKAAYEERSFDVRQLVVAGEPCHSIARVSRSPITNLHLRSERMSLEAVGLDANLRNSVGVCAAQALAAFPDSLVAGVDVLLSRGSLRPYVLDINPFGDLLYKVQFQGEDTYTWELMNCAKGEQI
ncbi:STM4014 family protein [Paenibacillus marchantiophytorum]|nr:STM4014 family protein [Paenibacillus marchantiophytorum]